MACSPLYEPTFSEIHTRTLQPSCALGGGACHAQAGRQGGLDLSTEASAWQGLVTEGRVVPGSPGCSVLINHIDAHGRALMPPGAQLPEATRCTLRQWVGQGAQR